MTRFPKSLLLFAAAGLLLGYARNRWLQSSPEPPDRPPPVFSRTEAAGGPEPAHRWQSPTDSALLLAALEGEMVLAPLIAEASAADLRDFVGIFAALPSADPRGETGLFVTLIYLTRLEVLPTLKTILSWPDLGSKPFAVYGAFSGAREATETQMLEWLEKARLADCIAPAVLGAVGVHPLIVLRYLQEHENDLMDRKLLPGAFCRTRFAYSNGYNNGSTWEVLLAIAYTGWAKRDPVAAFAAAQRHPAWQRALRYPFMDLIRQRYPEKMMTWWSAEPIIPRELGGPRTGWLERLPMAKALDFVKVSPLLIHAAEPLIAAWARTDFAAAVEWTRHAAPAIQKWAWQGLLKGGQSDQLWALAETLPDYRRVDFAESILKQLVGQNPAEALQKLDRLPADRRQYFVNGHLRDLLQHDDSALVSYLEAHPGFKWGLSSFEFDQLNSWPEAVAERLLNLLPATPENAKKLVEVKSSGILREKVSATEAYERLLGLHQDEAAAASALMTQRMANRRSLWIDSGREKALEAQEWLAAQPPALQKAVLPRLHEYCYAIATNSPDVLFPVLASGFAQLAPDQLENYQNTMRQVVKDLAPKKSPDELIRWMEALPVNAVTEVARVATAEAWLLSDPMAASAWVRSWPDGLQKEQAASSIVLTTIADDSEAAMKWLEVIRDPQLRDACISQVAEKVAAFDVPLARSWMKQISDPKVRRQFESNHELPSQK